MKTFIPVMLTPFKPNGDVDFDMLARLTEFYLEAGAGGLFANCLSSEMFELTAPERLRVIQTVIRAAGGSVPVVATGTFGGPLHEQADFVKRVHDLGTAAVIGITGLLAEESDSDEVFYERFFALLDHTPGVPMGLYECPVPYKRLVSAEQLGRFTHTGRVTYHKDTSLDIMQVSAKIAATKDCPGFGLYDAYMVHAVASLEAGSAGLSCIQGNFFPEMVSWLCANFDDPTVKTQVSDVQNFFSRNMDVMHHVYPTVAKYVLNDRGFPITSTTRRKVGEFTPEVKSAIQALQRDYAQLRRQLALPA